MAAHLALGACLQRAGWRDAARRVFEKAEQIAPWHRGVAEALLRLGDEQPGQLDVLGHAMGAHVDRHRLLASSVGLVGLARLTVVGLLALAFGAFIGFGGAAMMFIYRLRPEFFGEHQARLRHARRHAKALRH